MPKGINDRISCTLGLLKHFKYTDETDYLSNFKTNASSYVACCMNSFSVETLVPLVFVIIFVSSGDGFEPHCELIC